MKATEGRYIYTQYEWKRVDRNVKLNKMQASWSKPAQQDAFHHNNSAAAQEVLNAR